MSTGYLILRIEKKEAAMWTRAERDAAGGSHVIARLRTRHSLRDPKPSTWKALGLKHGFELTGILYGPEVAEWPFTAYCYVSRNYEGHGRCGSTLHRIPARRVDFDTIEPRRMTGRCANGSERDGGTIFHATLPGHRIAFCGSTPGNLSGWATDTGDAVTCERCARKVERLKKGSAR